jgi:hypothetical protein
MISESNYNFQGQTRLLNQIYIHSSDKRSNMVAKMATKMAFNILNCYESSYFHNKNMISESNYDFQGQTRQLSQTYLHSFDKRSNMVAKMATKMASNIFNRDEPRKKNLMCLVSSHNSWTEEDWRFQTYQQSSLFTVPFSSSLNLPQLSPGAVNISQPCCHLLMHRCPAIPCPVVQWLMSYWRLMFFIIVTGSRNLVV